MDNTLKITLIQSRLHWREPDENRAHLEAAIRSEPGSDLYVLPETFTTGFLGETRETDETEDGPTVAWMRALAAELDAGICGSAVIGDEAGRRNRFLLVHPDGRVDRYDKRHLFGFAGEDRRYVAGDDRVVLTFRGWRICPQICYDLRFPAWCRVRHADYDLLLFVANWPARRVDAWDALLKARAIENQCVVVAVNRVGEDGNGLMYPGHSAIYDPFGHEIVSPEGGERVVSGEASLDQVRQTREDFPFDREADEYVIQP